jgi:hypothetical protein
MSIVSLVNKILNIVCMNCRIMYPVLTVGGFMYFRKKCDPPAGCKEERKRNLLEIGRRG